MGDHGEAVTPEMPEVDNLLLPEDGTTENNSISSNLAMVFAKLPELLAQTKRHLDSPSASSSHNMAAAAATEHYISCIKINGVPILPPVLDEHSKQEMRMYREEAIRRSKEREKHKQLISTPEPSVSAHSPLGNESKNYSQDSLEYSQQNTALAQALASNISPQSHSTTGNDQVTPLEMPAGFLSDSKHADSILNSLSDLGSLDDGSLPTQLHGIPLTSKSEQQITRDLSTLNKHLSESYRSAHPEICDLSLDLNARLPAWSPAIDTVEKCAFSFSPPPIFLTSTSSPVNDANSHPNPDHALEADPNNSQINSSPIFKAPIFLTENDGLHLTVKKQSPTSLAISPSLKASPAVSEQQQWIMNSPLIAYVTKKRPKPVGMPSLSVKPDPLTKSQRVNNATFTIFKEKLAVQNVCDQDDNDDKLLKRPVINTEQRSSTPIAELSNNCNNSSISAEKKSSPSKLTALSPSRKKCQPCSQSDLSKSPPVQRRYSLKLKPPKPIDKRRYTYSGTPSLIRPLVYHRRTNNNDCSVSDIPKINLNDAISLASTSLSTSPQDCYTKEHLGDDSLDELILGVENIGLVPRIDGDGSDVPSPLSTSKDLPISSGQKETKQAWQKDSAFHSSGLVRANFSPVGTDSPHHLQVSVAAVDVTTSSGVASLSDISDSPVTCMPKQQSKISSVASDSSAHCTNSGIRRGSYTLLEPSINLTKLARLTPSPTRDDHNSSSISERIPSYADFEIDLHKRIPSKKQSSKCGTPSKLVTPVKSISVLKPFHSDPKSSQEMQLLDSKSPFLKRSKSVNRIKRTKDSFHLTPPTKRNFSKCFQNEKSKKSKLSDSPQPTVAKKKSPKSFREWRLSNIDCKVSPDFPKKDVENMKLKDEQSLNVSVDSPLLSPSLPSPSLINENPLDWDNKIVDQMKCFFSEKKDSFFKLKRDFNDWQGQIVEDEENFNKTFESIKLFKQSLENGRTGCDFLTPDISFTSTEPGQMETPIKQLFVPQTPVVSSDSSHVSLPADNVRKPKSTNPVLERIPAAAKGFLTRRLLSCPKVISLRKTMTECQLLLKEVDYNTNIDFIDRIHNQLESSRQEIHAIFFEQTVAEKMSLIKQSRELRNKPLKEKAPQLSYATQKYLLRKNTEKASIPNNKTVSLRKVPSVKQTAVSQSSVSPKKIVKQKSIQTKKENQSIRKIAQPSVSKPKPNNVVSVPGKMTATRIVATKAIASPLNNNSHKPWR